MPNQGHGNDGQKNSLGRGLQDMGVAALLQRLDKPVAPGTNPVKEGFQLIAIDLIDVCPYQPRQHLTPSHLAELAESIRNQGVIQPLLVRPVDVNGSRRYQLVAGERRWRASDMAGLLEVPCLVKDLSDRDVSIMSLIENVQREDLSTMDQAEALAALADQWSLSHVDLAATIGKSRSHVTNLLRLNQLSDIVKQALREQKIDMGHARALLTLPADLQAQVTEEVIKKGLSVRMTELLVRKLSTQKTTKTTPLPTSWLLSKTSLDSVVKGVTHKFETKTEIKQQQSGKGHVRLYFNNQEDFKRILQVMELQHEELN